MTRQQILDDFLNKAAQVRGPGSGYVFSFNESHSCLRPLIELVRGDVGRKNLKASAFNAVRAELQRRSPKDSAKYRLILDRLSGDWPLFSDKQSAFLAHDGQVSTELSAIMTVHPDYNFATHSRSRLGLGTKFTLKARILAPNVTAADVGGLRWTITSGARQVSVTPHDGSICAVATDTAGAKCKLTTVDRAFQKHTETGSDLVLINALSIPVVAPNGANAVIRGAGFREGDPNHELSAFMNLDYYLTPNDVSFVGLEWREPGGEVAVLTGNLQAKVMEWVNARDTPNRRRLLLEHGGNPNDWRSVERTHNGLPNWINQVDKVGNTLGKECSPGTFVWTIKWDYRMKAHDGVPTGPAVTFKNDVEHKLTVEGDPRGGRAIISKLNALHGQNF